MRGRRSIFNLLTLLVDVVSFYRGSGLLVRTKIKRLLSRDECNLTSSNLYDETTN